MRLKIRGFTLIELMITVAIIAILSAIAVPSYQRYVLAARRTDALNILQRVAAAEEQFFFAHNAYTDNAGNELGLGAGGAIISNEGYYSVAIGLPGAGYQLTATPVAGGLQAQDTDCATFTLDNVGNKGSLPKGINICWKR